MSFYLKSFLNVIYNTFSTLLSFQIIFCSRLEQKLLGNHGMTCTVELMGLLHMMFF